MHSSTPTTPTTPEERIRVLVASKDQAYARGLAEALSLRGLNATSWELPRSNANGDAAQPTSDVLVVESDELSDAEWAFIEEVRERSPMIEILAISSDPLIESAVQALRIGLFAVLTYPLSDLQLLDAIRAAYDRKQRGELRLEAIDRTTR